MRTSITARLIACLLTVAVPELAMPPLARANACAGSHGAYTSVMCDGDWIVGYGVYIVSPDGSHRLYIQSDGHMVTYNGPTAVFIFYNGFAGPAYRMRAGAVHGTDHGYEIQEFDHTSLGVGYSTDGSIYISIHNDGCVWYHLPDDSFNSAACGDPV